MFKKLKELFAKQPEIDYTEKVMKTLKRGDIVVGVHNGTKYQVKKVVDITYPYWVVFDDGSSWTIKDFYKYYKVKRFY